MKKTIRVAQIIGKMHSGGVESVVFNYYRFLDKKVIQFDFFYDSDSSIKPPQELINMGAHFYEVPPYQKLPQYLSELRNIFHTNQYQIVHSHLNTLSIFPLFVAWLEGIPIRIAHNHSVPGNGEFLRSAIKYILRIGSKWFATDYFACSEKTGRWLFGNREYDSGNVKLIRNAIDFTRFSPKSNNQTSLKQLYDLDGKFVVGHIGRLTYAKNHLFLLETFALIKTRVPNSVLLLVGSGELHDIISVRVKELNLSCCVVMVGSVPDPERYYKLMNITLLPSKYEGLGLVAIESQIAKVPVIVSQAIPDEAIISNGCTRLTLEDGPQRWAETAIDISSKQVVLNENSENYRINRLAPQLVHWYLKRLDSLL